jgi:hypothetical protein
MKSVLAVTMLLLGAASGSAQAPGTPPPQRAQAAPPAANLNATLTQIQQAVQSANADIGRLRIDKWKTDSDQKQQLHQVSDSLQRNITNAMPGLISDVQASSGNVSTTFKLYHNLNVLYEFLSSLADAAGSLGKKEEYEPLANDAAALDTARQGLSAYIEQTAIKLESVRTPPATPSPQAAAPPPPKKIVIDDGDPPKQPVKPSKKKTSATSPHPAPAQR